MNFLQNFTTSLVESMRPSAATFLGATAFGSNALVLMDQIKGAAALITVVLGVPTAALILVYWGVKVYRQIRHGQD
jgi:hypothetical protein